MSFFLVVIHHHGNQFQFQFSSKTSFNVILVEKYSCHKTFNKTFDFIS